MIEGFNEILGKLESLPNKERRIQLYKLKKDIEKYEECLEENHDFGEWNVAEYSYKSCEYIEGEFYPTLATKTCWERTCKTCGCIERKFTNPNYGMTQK